MSKSIEKGPELDTDTTARVVDSLVSRGDISALSPAERSRYYIQLCESLGLNPASQPLAPLKLNGKEILYPTRGATDQLAAIHRVNREITEGPEVRDFGGTKLLYAKCRASLPNGRVETAVATLPVGDLVNALMKLETKAKRRATLSILGLGMLDELEIETIPERAKVSVDSLATLGIEITAPEKLLESAALAFLDRETAGADAEELDRLFVDLHRQTRASKAALIRAIAAEREDRKPAEPEALTTYAADLDLTESAAGVVAVWRLHVVALRVLGEVHYAAAKTLAAQAVVSHHGGTEADAATWLRAQLTPPKGPDKPRGGKPAPVAPPADPEGDAERAAIEGEAVTEEDYHAALVRRFAGVDDGPAWAEHLRRAENTFHAAQGYNTRAAFWRDALLTARHDAAVSEVMRRESCSAPEAAATIATMGAKLDGARAA